MTNYNTSDEANVPLGKDIRISRPASSAHRDRDEIIARRFYLLSLARELLPKERVSICFKYRAPHRATVDIYHDKINQRATISGVMRCTSVWNCPVCAASISMRRRDELKQAIAIPRFYAYMVTYTVAHGVRMPLKRTLEAINDSYRYVHSGRAYQALKADYGIIGSIKALEITHGEHGWHPHVHELAFTTMPPTLPDMTDIKNELQFRWIKRVHKHGYAASKKHAVQITSEHATTDEYVSKFGLEDDEHEWTAADELARASSKNARGKKGRTPFRLLEDYGFGDVKAGWLFVEYATAMKNKMQLQWSRGLRAALALDEIVTDSEAIETEADGMELLIMLSSEDWRAIAKAGKQAAVMVLARHGDASGIRELCNILKFGDRSKRNGTNEMS